MAPSSQSIPLEGDTQRIDQLEKFVYPTGKKIASLKKIAAMLDVSVDIVRRAIKPGNWKVSIEEVE